MNNYNNQLTHIIEKLYYTIFLNNLTIINLLNPEEEAFIHKLNEYNTKVARLKIKAPRFYQNYLQGKIFLIRNRVIGFL